MRRCRLSDSDLYLERDEDPAEPGVDAVAEREVDDAAWPAEIDSRFGPFFSERVEALAHATRQHHHRVSSCTLPQRACGVACPAPSGASSESVPARRSLHESEAQPGQERGDDITGPQPAAEPCAFELARTRRL
mgnify:CR=1 FL=1